MKVIGTQPISVKFQLHLSWHQISEFPLVGSFFFSPAFPALVTLIVSILCLSPQSLAQSPSPHAVSMYNLGLTAYRQGSPESAIIFFKRACDIDPRLADAQYNLGVIYQSQKRFKEAAPRFEQVLKVKPNDPDAHYQLALVLLELGQTQEARQHFASIPPNNVHFADAQKQIGLLLSSQPQQMTSSFQPGSTGIQSVSQSASQPIYDGQGSNTQSTASQPATVSASFKPEPAPSPFAPNSNSQLPQPAPPIQPIAPEPITQQELEAQPSQATGPNGSVSPTVATHAGTNYPQPPAGTAPPSTAPNPVPVIANSSVKVVASGFSAPAGLAFDKYGNLYVANFLTNTVDRIGVDGNRSQFSAGAHLKGPIGLSIDDLGNVYVANYLSGTVARINPAGVSTIIATGFRKPYYLALDKEGNIFVSQQEDNSVVQIALPRPVSSKL